MVTLLLLLLGIPLPPAPVRYVTDHADVLPFDRVAALEKKLRLFDEATSNQVIVYVVPSVPEGTTLEEMGAEAIRTWGVGQKGKDNGVILFVFPSDRKDRIEVGYGLEGTLTDAKSKRILTEVMQPYLRDGDYIGAVEQGTEAIVGVIAPGYAFTAPAAPEPASVEPVSVPIQDAPPFAEGKFVVFMLGFAGFMVLMKKLFAVPDAVTSRKERRFLRYVDESPNFDASPQPWAASSSGTSSSGHYSSGFSGSSSSSSSGGSSGGGSSSGGGFTGGGGSGGGGGASGSW